MVRAHSSLNLRSIMNHLRRSSILSFLVCSLVGLSPCAAQSVNKVVLNTEFTATFSRPTLYQGKVAFLTGSFGPPRQIAVTDGSDVTNLVTTATPYPPETSSKFTSFGWLASDGDTLYFAGNSSTDNTTKVNGGNYGLFAYDGTSVTSLLDDAGTLGKSSGLASVTGIEAGNDKVVFTIQQGIDSVDYFGYYLYDNGQITLVADTETNVNEGDGKLLELYNQIEISPNGEHIAFVAATKGGSFPSGGTLYRYVDGSLVAVIGESGSVGGTSFTYFPISKPVVLNDGTLFFNAFGMSGARPFIVDPNNTVSALPLPSHDGATAENVAFTATDGVYAYGAATVSSQAVFSVRYSVAAGYEVLQSFPFNAGGIEWGSYGFSYYDANAEGAIFSLYSTDFSKNGVFSNVDGLGVSLGGGDEVSSFWADYEDHGGWKRTLSVGWVYDPTFPYVFSYTFNSWLYIVAEGGSLDGYYFYNYREDAWYFTVEAFNGWVYQMTGDPIGWRFLSTI